MSVSLATKGMIVKDHNYGVGINFGAEIQIDPDRWQLISIPVQYGYFDTVNGEFEHDEVTIATIKNYVMDQISYIMNDVAEHFIQLANSYFGDEDAFRSYIPGVTNPNSMHNFPLAYEDNEQIEYTAFWIRSIHADPITIKWAKPEDNDPI